MKRLILLCLTIMIFWRGERGTAVAQTNPITIDPTTTINDFPSSLTFTTTASSSAGNIVSAKLIFTNEEGDGGTQNILTDIAPEQTVTLTYEWDTSRTTIVPSQPVYYYWQVTDAEGNRASSEIELVRYDDIRFDWQVLEDEVIAVWWHDQPATFGQQVFDIAHTAELEQRQIFQIEPELQIRILIYNTFDEFAAWHSFVNEFIGGQAFPGAGVTAQIVPPSSSQEDWLLNVLPHEIAHLYFYQATNSLSQPPKWLNEGLAQYLETNVNSFALRLAEQSVRNGERIPLYALVGSFGNQEEAVRLAYAEGLSAVTYLVEAYGKDGLADLLAAYKAGLYDEEAFQTALGVSPLEFEYEWINWLGASAALYPTPTIAPTATLFPTFAMMVAPTKRPSATPTSTAMALPTEISTETAVATHTLEPTAASTVAVVASTTAVSAAPPQPTATGGWAWLGVGLSLVIASGALIALRRS